jgi:cupin superfamily acireductone dioxygenase involved in methionine salvage
MKTLRMGSNDLIHAPGVIRYAVEMGKDPDSAVRAMDIIAGWTRDYDAIKKVLAGDYRVVGDVVEVDVEDERGE